MNNIKYNYTSNDGYFKLVPISTLEKLAKINDEKLENLLEIVNEKEDYKSSNSVCGIGINDIGKKYGFVWNTQPNNIVDTTSNYEYRVYKLWLSMLNRAYGKNKYDNCMVDERWLNFSNFIQDIPKIPGFDFWLENKIEEKICLDKDIKPRVNQIEYNNIDNIYKMYSLENCMFVPESINHMVIKNSNKRGDCPIGVSHKRNKFRSTINTHNIKFNKDLEYDSEIKSGQISLGVFEDKHSAFLIYKFNKELLIQGNATYMYENGKIYKELYENLMKYQVLETD